MIIYLIFNYKHVQVSVQMEDFLNGVISFSEDITSEDGSKRSLSKM